MPIVETVDEEFVQLECLFHQRSAALNGFADEIKAYPEQLKKLLASQQAAFQLATTVEDTVRSELAELASSLGPQIDTWAGQVGLSKRLSDLQSRFRATESQIKKRNARCQEYDRARAQGPVSPKVKASYQQLNMELKGQLPLLFREAVEVIGPCVYELEGLHLDILRQWKEVTGEAAEIDEAFGQRLEDARCALAIIMTPTSTDLRIEENGKVQEESPRSPGDVPIADIEEAAGSPMFKVNRPQGISGPIITEDESEDEADLRPMRSIAELAKSFEKLHTTHSPRKNTEQPNSDSQPEHSPPPLPTGQSRVAALAAQLEASKIIFRPMLPTARAPRTQEERDREDEGEEGTYERHLGRRNPFAPTALPGRRIKRKEEVPPTPPRKAYVLARHDFSGAEKGDLAFKRGDRIEVLVRGASEADWWTGRLEGRIGLFPANYTRPL